MLRSGHGARDDAAAAPACSWIANPCGVESSHRAPAPAASRGSSRTPTDRGIADGSRSPLASSSSSARRTTVAANADSVSAAAAALQAGATWTNGAAGGAAHLAGVLAAKLVPGRRVPLVTELPPMRLPLMANVAKKTGGRLKWYLIEVIPLFLFGTLLMFVLDRTGVLPAIIEAGEPLVTGWLGLPKEASAAFVMGFLRRDFGATGLFALGAQLSPQQTVVGMVTITLFVPCIASMMMMIKEQGARTAALMIGMIVPFAFLVGGLLNHLLRLVW